MDEERLAAEARFDGLWVLRTNTDQATPTVALQYKGLWQVESLIRTTKSILETRPIYHKCDETIRGHVFCSFLALLLKTELERRLAESGQAWEWAEVLRGLDHLTAYVADGKLDECIELPGKQTEMSRKLSKVRTDKH